MDRHIGLKWNEKLREAIEDAMRRLIFIHGLFGNSQGVKATLLRGLYPDVLTPDFVGGLDERMAQLETCLEPDTGWTIVGSSFGGLMGALYTCQQPDRVRKLVLFAPALIWPAFAENPPGPVGVPTVIYHGTQDEIIPLSVVKTLSEQVFEHLTFNVVEDDHGLYKTVHEVDWTTLLEVREY
jgi:pimeloyl-ACP methyl ester carboxylesterase